MVIEHLEVQRTVDVQVSVTRDGISQTGAIVELRTSCP